MWIEKRRLASTVHSEDLWWFLTKYLGANQLAVPVGATSGSQDWFVILYGQHILGVANKAVSPNNGTAWADLRAELGKIPSGRPAAATYTLVVITLAFRRMS
jgi:hypothetical protein